MNYVDVFYQSDDGLRLYARDYPGPARDAPVILCLPGLTRNSKDFAPLAEKLRTAYRVICPDQRGRGRSARDADPARYRPDRYVQDMRNLLDMLGITKVVVIGTSLGGLMAMIMMATDAGRIRAAVLNDVGPEVDPRGLARIAGYVGKSGPVRDWDAAAAQTAHTNGVAFPDYRVEDWQAMAREIYVQEGPTPVLDYDPAIALGVSNGTTAPNLWPLFELAGAKPLLVVRGETSDILSTETLAEMTRRLPHIITQNVSRRGHAPTLSEPEAWSAIDKFLGGLEQSAV
ncbi:MAG: alpha/beta hydrolase [Betaproteobacteria bacterium]|nr:alpha/beta hydrolase [Betaproteobacteria bacterium]